MFVSYYLGTARAESALNCPACLMCVYARMRVRARVRKEYMRLDSTRAIWDEKWDGRNRAAEVSSDSAA